MALNRAQLQAVKDWCNLHRPACPLCSSKAIALEGMNVMPGVDAQGPMPVPGFVAVPVVCSSCGHTTLVSATALKLVQPSTPPTKIT